MPHTLAFSGQPFPINTAGYPTPSPHFCLPVRHPSRHSRKTAHLSNKHGGLSDVLSFHSELSTQHSELFSALSRYPFNKTLRFSAHSSKYGSLLRRTQLPLLAAIRPRPDKTRRAYVQKPSFFGHYLASLQLCAFALNLFASRCGCSPHPPPQPRPSRKPAETSAKNPPFSALFCGSFLWL